MTSRKIRTLLSLALMAGVIPPFVPQLLAFPQHFVVSGHDVWSETPADRIAIARVLARADSLVAASPIASGTEYRRIFLTKGGWRWRWLALQAYGSFGISRAWAGNIVINRSDIAEDLVVTGASTGGRRHLSSVIAHETAHGLLRRRYGVMIDIAAPRWLREGYCDHVAQESSLTAEQAAQLEADGVAHPALPYFHGRRRVAEILKANGGSVDALFLEK